ncbi:MAG: bifunctional DNA-binding transcriptional regulator/O6-methylguanine-DNA methyltransferase Ada, partial [Candidatus Rokuibacteriota bacterium]
MKTIMTATSPISPIDAERWRRVLARDAGNGFVYAVRTTGVYCRPSCASRRPRREHVAFFATPREAGAAGYRACRRCRPDAGGNAPSAADRVKRALASLESAETRPTLGELAAAAGVSRFHFHRLFKRLLGVTPREYAATRSLERLRAELGRGTPVTDAIFEAGFGSSSRVYEQSGETLGMTPGVYRAGAPGLAIAYTVVECGLGWLAVAATPRGVCSIELGDRPETLVRGLRARFPNAALVEDRRGLRRWVGPVLRFVSAPAENLSLPLDVQGTAFQRRVWNALRRLPVGATVSYTALARGIGRPRAVRAVARACATNPVALAIPCHRVVGSDSNLSGYRWGVERKRRILDLERAAQRGAPGIARRMSPTAAGLVT